MSIDLESYNDDPETFRTLKDQKTYSSLWRELDSNVNVAVVATVQEAIDTAKEIGEKSNGMQTFITGSFHLVGAALKILESGTE